MIHDADGNFVYQAPAPSPAPAPAPKLTPTNLRQLAANAVAVVVVAVLGHLAITFGGSHVVTPAVETIRIPWRVSALEKRVDRLDPVTPPGPTPKPIVDPEPARPTTGPFRLIVLHDSAANASQGQLDALNSTAARAYLSEHCAKDDDGRPAWRFWDAGVDASKESASWQKALAAARAKNPTLPALIIFHADGKVDTASLPNTEAAFLALLQAIGG